MLAVAAGVLNRMGGSANYHKIFRRLGVPLCIAAQLLVWGYPLQVMPLVTLFLSIGLMFAALGTYYDPIFGYDNYYAHALGVALACFPMSIGESHYIGFAIRAIICCVAVGLWSKLETNDVREEFGRGFIIALTTPLLFL